MSNLYPKSVCIIADGNRIYSILLKKYKHLGEHAYRAAWDKVEDLSKYLFSLPYIEDVFFVVTIRNNHLETNRQEVIKPVADYLGEYMDRLMPSFKDYGVRVDFIGDVGLFIETSNNPIEIKRVVDNTKSKTSGFNDKFLYLMFAYDYYHELLDLINKINMPVHSIGDLRIKYYGRYMQDLDLIIRTGRPRLSRAIPMLISEYADFYIFPAPFSMLETKHIDDIFEDYRDRISSKGGKLCYSDNDIDAMQEFSLDDFNCDPLVLGTKVGNVWLPILNNKRIK
jgi:undecaprenyl diphosphate synthase